MTLLGLSRVRSQTLFFFFFNDTATTEIYTLSLHDALPISVGSSGAVYPAAGFVSHLRHNPGPRGSFARRSEEHTSELQSRLHLVCRLLLEKKKKTSTIARASKSPCTCALSWSRDRRPIATS